MAHYAYKNFCYDIDLKEFTKRVEEFKKKYKRECDEDPNYDGDYWSIAADWLSDVLEENKKLKELIKEKLQ